MRSSASRGEMAKVKQESLSGHLKPVQLSLYFSCRLLLRVATYHGFNGIIF